MAQVAKSSMEIDGPKVTRDFGTILNVVDPKARTFEAITSTPTVDRDMEFVPVSAFVKRLPIYMENPVLLLGHQHKTTRDSLPIGRCIAIEPREEGLWAKFYLATTPVGEECLTLINEGCLRGLSAGFVPVDYVKDPHDHLLPPYLQNKGLKKYYKEVELVEISLLSIPSNREALITYAQKGNKVADMVMKSYEGQDVTPIIKEWLNPKSYFFIESVTKGVGMPDKAIAVFDLDGTLANVEHRIHLIEKKDPQKGDYDAFYEASVKDTPNQEIIDLCNKWASSHEIYIASGRSDQVREQTEKWLHDHDVHYDKLLMRPADNRQDDVDLKRDWVESGEIPKARVEIVYEDRPKMVEMWRGLGMDCRQIVDGLEESPDVPIVWKGFVTKLFNWDESEHPRAKDGEFTSSGSSSTPIIGGHYDPKDEQVNRKLDIILANQRRDRQDIEEIKDKDSWGNWAKGWIVKIGVVTGLYYGIKHAAKDPKTQEWVSKKISNWLKNNVIKELGPLDATDKLLGILTLTKAALSKAESIGATETEQYKKLKTFYDKMVHELKNSGHMTGVIETKEMTSGEFVESEHPRAEDGKFAKKNEGEVSQPKQDKIPKSNKKTVNKPDFFDDPKYKDMPTTRPSSVLEMALHAGVVIGAGAGSLALMGKSKSNIVGGADVLLALGIAGASQMGYVILRDSDILKSSENLQQAQVRADDVVKACPKPNPNKKALTNIINLQVENRVFEDSKRTKFQQQIIDYVNSDEFKKDLAKKFGHLPEGGTAKVVLLSHTQFNVFNVKNILNNNFCYFVGTDTIYINAGIHEDLSRVIGDEFTPRELLMHEYAHSITMKHDEVQQRHLKEYEGVCKGLIGKEIDIPTGLKLPDKWEFPSEEKPWGETVQVDPFGNMTAGRQKFKVVDYKMTDVDVVPELEKIKKLWPDEVDAALKNITSSRHRGAVFTVEDSEGHRKEFHTDGILEVQHYYGQFASQGDDPMKDIALNAIKIGNLDHRRVYGMSNLSEWISVKVEKGEKI